MHSVRKVLLLYEWDRFLILTFFILLRGFADASQAPVIKLDGKGRHYLLFKTMLVLMGDAWFTRLDRGDWNFLAHIQTLACQGWSRLVKGVNGNQQWSTLVNGYQWWSTMVNDGQWWSMVANSGGQKNSCQGWWRMVKTIRGLLKGLK